VVGWFVASVGLFSRAPRSGVRRLGVGLLLYLVAGGGVSVYNDPAIVLFIKENVHRIRPTNDIHQTFSFPSGHTNGAIFMIGFLLFVLLLPVIETSPQGEKDAVPEPKLAQATLVSIWIAAGLTTASGRMLADVHWMSDTMAGASLGAFLVSVGALAVNRLERMPMLPQDYDALEEKDRKARENSADIDDSS